MATSNTLPLTEPAHNFFITGGTLPPNASSYVERKADEDLLSTLLAGEYCFVLNSRQMGKSSLSVRTMNKLREAGIRTAFIDLTGIGGSSVTPEQWYAGMLAEIGRALGLRKEMLAHWAEHKSDALITRFFGAIREVALNHQPSNINYQSGALNSPIVLFVDEIDAVKSLSFSTDEFFAGLRECYNRRVQDPAMGKLTVCLVGTAAPSDLIVDTRTSPFNIGRRIDLADFTRKECAPLAVGLSVSGRGEVLLDRIYYWTNGHPYLTQSLCSAAIENSAKTASDIDRLVGRLFFDAKARERNPNLADVSNRILSSYLDPSHRDEHRAAILELYGTILRGRERVADDESNRLAVLLKLAGITRSENGRIRIRNRIYERVFNRRWIEQSMPDAELRRQKAAFKRGMARAASIGFGILAVISVLAIYADQQRRLAVGRNKDLRRSLYVAEMNQAQQAVDIGNLELARQLLQRQIPSQAGQEDLREFAWQVLWHSTEGEERRVLRGHQGPIYRLALSPDGKTIATAGLDKVVRLWDTGTGKQVAELQGHKLPIQGLTFSPDGRRLASLDIGAGQAALRPELKIWDVQNLDRIRLARNDVLEKGGEIESLTFSPDGIMLLGVQGMYAPLFNSINGNFKFPVRWRMNPMGCAIFLPGGKQFVVVGLQRIGVYEVATQRELRVFAAHDGMINAVALSPDGRKIVTAGEDRTIQTWDTNTWKRLSNIQNNDAIRCVAYSPDGRTVATGGVDGVLKIWNTSDWKEIAQRRGHGKKITNVAFSPDGGSVYTSSEDGTARIWDSVAAIGDSFLPAQKRQILSHSFASAGNMMAICDSDRITLWNGRRLVHIMKALDTDWPYIATAFSPDGKLLAAASPTDHVAIWNVADGNRSGARLWHDHDVYCVAFSPDGKVVAAGSRAGTVKTWDVATHRETHCLKGGDFKILAVAFSPTGQYLASCSQDGSVAIWDPKTGKQIASPHGHLGPVYTLAFHPTRRLLATGGQDGTIRLWNSVNWKEEPALRPRLNNVVQLAFSPDGKTLAAAHGRNAITLWNMHLLREIAILHSNEYALNSVAFSPDGRTLTAGSSTGAVKTWETVSQSIRSESEAKVTRSNAETQSIEEERFEVQRKLMLAGSRLETSGAAQAEMRPENGATRVDIGTVDSTDWHAQVINAISWIRDGDLCTIQFRAKADHTFVIGLKAQTNEPDFHDIGFYTPVPLTTAWRTYNYTFRATKTARSNRVPVFLLGKEVGTVWISGLTVQPKGRAAISLPRENSGK